MPAATAWPLAKLGRTAEARATLSEAEAGYEPPVLDLVRGYAALGDPRAFKWTHRAIAEHQVAVVPFLPIIPLYSGLREDPRWEDVLAHIYSESAASGELASRGT